MSSGLIGDQATSLPSSMGPQQGFPKFCASFGPTVTPQLFLSTQSPPKWTVMFTSTQGIVPTGTQASCHLSKLANWHPRESAKYDDHSENLHFPSALYLHRGVMLLPNQRVCDMLQRLRDHLRHSSQTAQLFRISSDETRGCHSR